MSVNVGNLGRRNYEPATTVTTPSAATATAGLRSPAARATASGLRPAADGAPSRGPQLSRMVYPDNAFLLSPVWHSCDNLCCTGQHQTCRWGCPGGHGSLKERQDMVLGVFRHWSGGRSDLFDRHDRRWRYNVFVLMQDVIRDNRAKSGLSSRFGSVLILSFIGGLVSALYVWEPGRGGVFPPCPFHTLTGLKCPGCGTLRALHHIAHGDLPGGFQLNPLMVLCLPLAFWFVGSQFSTLLTGRPLRGLRLNKPFWGWAVLGVILLYGVLRNIFPFLGG